MASSRDVDPQAMTALMVSAASGEGQVNKGSHKRFRPRPYQVRGATPPILGIEADGPASKLCAYCSPRSGVCVAPSPFDLSVMGPDK